MAKHIPQDLGATQADFAKFLPALSSFFATYIGKQRSDPNAVEPHRIPSGFPHGMESINYLNKTESLFYYPWTLYSAGHANLDLNKVDPREDMVRARDRANTFLLADSGGFQIGKGVWEGDWKDPACPKAEKQRKLVLNWLDNIADYSMVLDIPTWICDIPYSRERTKIESFADAVKGTIYNNEYFIARRRGIEEGGAKFLNVLQGQNHSKAEEWYQIMKKYSDPKLFPGRHFNGWAMGGQNMADVHLMLKRIVTLIDDGLLEEGVHDWMHFLGTSKLEMGLVLTDIQRAVRKYHNPKFTISFDCASPFLATANGQLYTDIVLKETGSWTYRMEGSVDDKKYATDSRLFADAVTQDKIFKNFISSPVTDAMKISDICIYKPGDLNKIGKEGRTSWDSFSYALQMSHNIWMHIVSVQSANAAYDQGNMPEMLHQIHGENVRAVIDEIFSLQNKKKALELIEKHCSLWRQVVGGGKKRGDKVFNTEERLEALADIEVSLDKEINKKVEAKLANTEIFNANEFPDSLTNKDPVKKPETKLANTGLFEIE